MKGIFVALIVVGSVALGAGAVIVGYNVVKGRKSDNYVTNRHEINEEIIGICAGADDGDLHGRLRQR